MGILPPRRGNGQIKVVTGIRRCGKSYLLLRPFLRMLAQEGVSSDHVIAVDLEDYANRRLRDPEALYEHV